MIQTESPLRYRRELRPIMEMLLSKKKGLDGKTWGDSVHKTLEYVLRSPDQYLNLSDAPHKEILQEMVYALFNEFRENLTV